MLDKIVTDVLVIGSGAAGLCAAIAARQENVETLVVSISPPGAGNTTAVAGGLLNAAVGDDDSPELHLEDTLRAGLLLNDPRRVAAFVEAIPRLLAELEKYGVGFARRDADYVLTRSGGHTRSRTLLFQPRIGTTLSRPLTTRARLLGVKALPNFNVVRLLV